MGRRILQSGLKCGKNTSSGVNLKWLEIRCTGNGTVGSNPTHSANFLLKVFNQKRSDWTLSLYFTTFSSFFRPLYVGQILISCKFQCWKRLVQQGFPGFWRENRREKATPFPSEIQVLKAWHLPRTALCCSLDGHRCLPSWKITVSQPILNLLHRNTVCQHAWGTTMSEIMEANAPQAVCIQQLRKLLRHIMRLDEVSHLVDADITGELLMVWPTACSYFRELHCFFWKSKPSRTCIFFVNLCMSWLQLKRSSCIIK